MIFFDLDGTLIDHDHAVKKALIAMLQTQDIQGNHSEDEIYEIWNGILEKYYDLYLQGKLSHSEQRTERMKAFYNFFSINLNDEEVVKSFNVYLGAYEENWILYEDVCDCLNSLIDRRLGIISNGYLNQQTDKLENTGIKDWFEIIVTSNEVGIAKPNKEIFLYACDQSEVNIMECVYVGDRWDADAIGSRSAGMRGIWLDRTGTYNGIRDGIEVINSLKELKI